MLWWLYESVGTIIINDRLIFILNLLINRFLLAIFFILFILNAFVFLLSRFWLNIILIEINHIALIISGSFEIDFKTWAWKLYLLRSLSIFIRCFLLILVLRLIWNINYWIHFIKYLLNSFVIIGCTGGIVISIKEYPRMEAIKFELSICQKIFMCQLIIHLIFSMNSVSFNLFRSLQFRKLPIKNPAFILVPKQQIISLKFFLCSIPHPLFRRYCLVVIFQHLLADHVTDSVYDIE
jgi:hypothetical protein